MAQREAAAATTTAAGEVAVIGLIGARSGAEPEAVVVVVVVAIVAGPKKWDRCPEWDQNQPHSGRCRNRCPKPESSQ